MNSRVMILSMKQDLLIGKWKIRRGIFDGTLKTRGHMRGVALFSPLSEDELIYHEELWHQAPRGSLHLARKSYRYCFEQEKLHIFFYNEEQNRLFLTLPFSEKKMSGEMTCGLEHYYLSWVWKRHNAFSHRFRVRGETKNYLIESEFRKCA